MNCKELFSNKTLQKQITNNAGIYIFKNIINNKYYVGQAIRIKKRLVSHIGNFNNSRCDNPLYRAFSKYGLENFEYQVLEDIEGSDYKQIRVKLDSLEKQYIQKFNSYSNGYNQTLGADGGILGYKFTEEQCEKNRQNRLNFIAKENKNRIYCYDLQNKTITMSIAPYYLEETLNWKHGTVHSAIHYDVFNKRYIIRHSIEEIEAIKNKIFSENYNSGKFRYKISIEQYKEFKNRHPYLPIAQLAKKLNICKKTAYNYEHILGNTLKKSPIKYIVIDCRSNTKLEMTVEEGSKYFALTKETFRKTANRKSKDGSLYKKIYKFIKL